MSYVPRSLVLLTSLLLVLGGCLSGCDLFDSGSGPGPRLEDIPGKIVYTASVPTGSDQTNQVFVTDQEGTRQLTATDVPYENARDPVWSPDGKRIAFSWYRGHGGDELYVMQADGSEKRPLVQPPTGVVAFGSQVAWAPSGDRIAFQACPVCNLGGISSQIFVADLQSGAVDTLTTPRSDNAHPTWSPDGQRIAFISNRDYINADSARYRTDLYLMNADGSDVQRLTTFGKAGPPTWSPSSGHIAIAYQSHDADVYLYDFTTDEVTRLTDLRSVGRTTWHPDGERILVPATTHAGQSVMRIVSLAGDTIQDSNRSEGMQEIDWHVE